MCEIILVKDWEGVEFTSTELLYDFYDKQYQLQNELLDLTEHH